MNEDDKEKLSKSLAKENFYYEKKKLEFEEKEMKNYSQYELGFNQIKV